MNNLTQSQINQQNLKYYKDVPQENLEPFLLFREQHPFKKTTINNTNWEYLDAGNNSHVILLLTGVLGVPIIDWRHIRHFSEKYRIIAPCYPELPSMNLLVDGIADILHSEGITSAHVWGGSYGGAVAQVFVRRYPELTKKLIVSHSFAPNKESAISLRKMLRWMRLLPGFLLRWVLKLLLNRMLPGDGEGMALTIGVFNELMHTRMTRNNILAILSRTVEYSEMTFKPDDLHSWPGTVLLIMSEDDPTTPEEVRSTFQTLYPGAKTHLFHGTGHASSLLREDEYRAVIESFTKA